MQIQHFEVLHRFPSPMHHITARRDRFTSLVDLGTGLEGRALFPRAPQHKAEVWVPLQLA